MSSRSYSLNPLGLLPRPALRFMLLLVLCLSVSVLHAAPKLYGFKIVAQENLMLHFDLDEASATAEIFTLSDPHRLVIDLPKARLGTELPSRRFSHGPVKAVRYHQHESRFLRVVLDLRLPVVPEFKIVPRQGGQRLIVDMGIPADRAHQPAALQARPVEPVAPRDTIIAIDAGHGGRDPGAIGSQGTREKDVNLSVARLLFDKLARVTGVQPVLIRDDDTFVGLRERMDRARAASADVFVSIHADAAPRKSARGSSVYALSLDGASSEAAKWLAKKENEAARLYGDVSLAGLDDSLRKTLLTLTQGNTMERSLEAGYEVLQQLEQIGPVHKTNVEQAAFAVLKSPDIPSVLVEMAFLSNVDDEKKLNDPGYLDRLAHAIGQGLVNYLSRRAPAGTVFAEQRPSHSG